MASFNVRLPESTPTTSAPSMRMRADVERLPRHVLGAHVHDAFQAEMRRDGCRSYAVLPRARFRNDARLAHFHRQQTLADGVIDFVRAGVQQIFALQINPRAAELGREASANCSGVGRPAKFFSRSARRA